MRPVRGIPSSTAPSGARRARRRGVVQTGRVGTRSSPAVWPVALGALVLLGCGETAPLGPANVSDAGLAIDGGTDAGDHAREDAGGAPADAGLPNGCDVEGAFWCQGDVLTQCVLAGPGLVWRSQNCGARGLVCAPSETGGVCVCPPNGLLDFYVDARAGSVVGEVPAPTGLEFPPECRYRRLTDALATAGSRATQAGPTRVIATGATADAPMSFDTEPLPLTVPPNVTLTTSDPELRPELYTVTRSGEHARPPHVGPAMVAMSGQPGDALSLSGFTLLWRAAEPLPENSGAGPAIGILRSCLGANMTLESLQVRIDSVQATTAFDVRGDCRQSLRRVDVESSGAGLLLGDYEAEPIPTAISPTTIVHSRFVARGGSAIDLYVPTRLIVEDSSLEGYHGIRAYMRFESGAGSVAVRRTHFLRSSFALHLLQWSAGSTLDVQGSVIDGMSYGVLANCRPGTRITVRDTLFRDTSYLFNTGPCAGGDDPCEIVLERISSEPSYGSMYFCEDSSGRGRVTLRDSSLAVGIYLGDVRLRLERVVLSDSDMTSLRPESHIELVGPALFGRTPVWTRGASMQIDGTAGDVRFEDSSLNLETAELHIEGATFMRTPVYASVGYNFAAGPGSSIANSRFEASPLNGLYVWQNARSLSLSGLTFADNEAAALLFGSSSYGERFLDLRDNVLMGGGEGIVFESDFTPGVLRARVVGQRISGMRGAGLVVDARAAQAFEIVDNTIVGNNTERLAAGGVVLRGEAPVDWSFHRNRVARNRGHQVGIEGWADGGASTWLLGDAADCAKANVFCGYDDGGVGVSVDGTTVDARGNHWTAPTPLQGVDYRVGDGGMVASPACGAASCP